VHSIQILSIQTLSRSQHEQEYRGANYGPDYDGGNGAQSQRSGQPDSERHCRSADYDFGQVENGQRDMKYPNGVRE
jgi:hypothetical protein